MRCFDLVVVEGDLEVAIAARLLGDRGHEAPEHLFLNKRGQAAFWADAARYNEAARNIGVLALVDLERVPCPGMLLARKLPRGKAPGFVLRIAVRMSESWLLADSATAAAHFGIPESKLPRHPDVVDHPKKELVRLVSHYAPDAIRKDMVPAAGRPAMVGPLYEERLAEYVRDRWNPLTAANRSPSLKRSLRAIETYLAGPRVVP